MNITAASGREPEPAGMTLADLVALVVGAGLALSLAWYSSWTSLRPLGTTAAPWWYVALRYTGEGLRKACLALFPVILARRVRNGGPLRPAEFAAFCIGFPHLLHSLSSVPAIGMVVRDPDRLAFPTMNMDLFRLWERAEFGAAAVAGLAFWLGRRRLPPWSLGLLVVVVWQGLCGPVGLFFQGTFNRILIAQEWPSAANHVASLLFHQLPFSLLYDVPLVAAARSLGRPGKTWLDWTAASLVVAGWLINQGLNFTDQWSSPWYRRESFVLDTMLPVVSVAISLAIVRRLGPTWGPRLGIGDEPRPRPALESGDRQAMMAESSAGD